MEYKNPTPTVDILIERNGEIVLVKRKNPPHGWALPGGYVDEGESIEHAAMREAREETGLDVTLDELFYVYSDPHRDPRQHTMTSVFIAHAQGEPRGDDDAEEARYWDLQALPEAIAFDHRTIIDDYVVYTKTGERRELARALTRITCRHRCDS